MDNKNGNEMEQIQRGLEEFLEKEMERSGRQKSVSIIGQGREMDAEQEEDWDAQSYQGEYFSKSAHEHTAESRRGRFYEQDGEYSDREPYEREEEYPRRRRPYGQKEEVSSGGVYEQEEYPRRRNPEREEEYPRRRNPEREEEYPRRRNPEREEEYPRRRNPEREEEYPRRRNPEHEEEYPRRRSPEREEEYPRRRSPAREGEYSREDYDREEAYSEDDIYDWDRKLPKREGRSQERTGSRRAAYEYGEEEVPRRRQKRSGTRSSEDISSYQPRQSRKEEPPMAKKAQKKRKKKHRLLKFLIAVAVIFILLGVGMYQLVGVVYGKMTYHEIASITKEPMKEDGVVNILLIGNDSRENGEDGRSDAMILLSISSKTKKIYMTSLLRDIYVDIPGHDGNRLNAAYSFGGAELLMETIEKNFDISVNRYVLVNFEAFASLVDAVDGIELELTSEEIEYVNGYLVEYNMLTDRPQGTDNMDTSVSGLVHLNGPQALAYSRNRYLGTDFGRTDRQRKVLTAVIQKLPSALLTNSGGLMEGLLPNLTTNLTQGECFQLSLMAGKMLTYDIVSDSIPQPGTYRDATIRSMAVLEVDFDTNIRYLKEKLYGE